MSSSPFLIWQAPPQGPDRCQWKTGGGSASPVRRARGELTKSRRWFEILA